MDGSNSQDQHRQKVHKVDGLQQIKERLGREKAEWRSSLINLVRDGLDFSVVPCEWQQDSEFVAAAIDGRSLSWEDLPKQFLSDLHVLLAALQRPGYVENWESVPPEFRSHTSVVMAALIQSLLQWNDVPQHLQRNDKEIAVFGVRHHGHNPDLSPCLLRERSFMKRQFVDAQIKWGDMPTALRTDMDYARSIEEFPDLEHAASMFEHLVPARNEKMMWEKVIDFEERSSMKTNRIRQLIGAYATEAIKSDWELMSRAVTADESVWYALDELGRNTYFLSGAVHSNLNVFGVLVEANVDRLHPDVISVALKAGAKGPDLPTEKFIRDACGLDISYWDDRDFVLGYCELGYPLLEERQFQRWKSDQEIILMVAKHCIRNSHCRKSFKNLSSEALLRDKQFMWELLKVRPNLCWQQAPSFFNYGEIFMRVHSKNEWVNWDQLAEEMEIAGKCIGEKRRDEAALEFVRSGCRRMKAREDFMNVVLPAMSLKSFSDSTLFVLNQGAETSKAYKSLIAEYLDVPIVQEYEMLEKATRAVDYFCCYRP